MAKKTDKRTTTLFGAIPLRALADKQLTELHLRTLGIISYHDRMSLVIGAGQGCWASSATMAEEMGGFHLTNVSTAISQLEKWGYIQIEKRPGDRRLRVYRVLFDPPNDLPVGQITDGQVDQDRLPSDKQSQKVVCPDSEPTPQKTAIPEPQYISLSEEIDLAEATKGYSAEAAHRTFSATRIDDFSPSNGSRPKGKTDCAEARVGRVSIYPLLSRSFADLPTDVKLIRIEEAFTKIGRNADALESRERDTWAAALGNILEDHYGEPIGHHAERLLEEVMRY